MMKRNKDKFLEHQIERFSQRDAERIFNYLEHLEKEEIDYWAQKEYEEWLNKECNGRKRKENIRR